jgi:hypothetical protein
LGPYDVFLDGNAVAFPGYIDGTKEVVPALLFNATKLPPKAHTLELLNEGGNGTEVLDIDCWPLTYRGTREGRGLSLRESGVKRATHTSPSNTNISRGHAATACPPRLPKHQLIPSVAPLQPRGYLTQDAQKPPVATLRRTFLFSLFPLLSSHSLLRRPSLVSIITPTSRSALTSEPLLLRHTPTCCRTRHRQ